MQMHAQAFFPPSMWVSSAAVRTHRRCLCRPVGRPRDMAATLWTVALRWLTGAAACCRAFSTVVGNHMEPGSELKVRLRGSRRQFTGSALIFNMNQMSRCDCLPHFCEWENKSIRKNLHSALAKCQRQTQNSKSAATNQHTLKCCCANEITTQQGSGVLEIVLQAMIEPKVKVREGSLEGAQKTTKVFWS